MRRSIQTARWRVFYTRSNTEKAVEQRLLEQDIETVLPKCLTVRQWTDRKKEILEPLFRNYIFARVDERARIQTLQTAGVVACVQFGGRMAEVSEDEMERLRIMQRTPERLAVLRERMPALGTHVTIRQGPLEGLSGDVIELRGQFCLVVQIHAIQQSVRVHVPAAWVEAVPSEATLS